MADDFELIFCDDSEDDTPRAIEQLHRTDPRVKLSVCPAASRGQAIAITAGLDYCAGDAVIIMDADLQDPPEAIAQLVDLWKQGNELVYVQRESGTAYFGYRFLSFSVYSRL